MVNGTLEKPYKVNFSDGRHVFCSDLLPTLGGEDKGPNPHEILEAALVGCTLQTMQMYGSRKGWDLGMTKVGVKVLEEGAQVRIGRVLHFDPHLTEEQKMKLTEIANKCPIHKLLHAPITVDTERA
jgi:putative redox protein